MSQAAQLTVWYDGACPLCIREIALMRKLDRARRIEFIDAAQEAAQCPLDRALMLRRLHARKGEKMHSGAAAFAAMWREIPALRVLGLMAQNRFVLAGLEWGYVQFLKIRPSLQKLVR